MSIHDISKVVLYRRMNIAKAEKMATVRIDETQITEELLSAPGFAIT